MRKGDYLFYCAALAGAAFLLMLSLSFMSSSAVHAQEEKQIAQAGQAEQTEPKPLRAFLNVNRFFYYEGDPVEVEVTLGNTSNETMKNPVDAPFSRWFVLKDETGKEVKASVSADDSGEEHPSVLKPQFFYGIMLDLTKNLPELKKAGKYKLRWRSGVIESDELDISVIKRYDSEKEYYALIETDFGNVKLDFFQKEAPLAVKAFIDFANAGFYDGQIFYQAKPADYVMAGDPKGDGSGTSGFPFPAEFNSIPIVAGTVMMSQFLAAPARNDGKFLIALKTYPEKTGILTVFAQVTDGLDAIKKISTVPTTELVQEPYFKPLKDVVIKKITIIEKEKKK